MSTLHISNANDLKIIQELRRKNKKLCVQKDLLESTLLEMFRIFEKKMDVLEEEYIRISKDNDERK